MLRIQRHILIVLLALAFYPLNGTYALQAYVGQTEEKVPPKASFVRKGDLWMKEGEKESKVTEGMNVQQPGWSSDGRWVAFMNRVGNDQSELWVYDTGNKKLHQIVKYAESFSWAPNEKILAYQTQAVLNVVDLRQGTPASFVNVALGVNQFTWLPDGTGFVLSTSAVLLPDGWTNPLLYLAPLPKDVQSADLIQVAEKWVTIPSQLEHNGKEILVVGTSNFLWSDDQQWLAFIASPTASWSADQNLLCVLHVGTKKLFPIDFMVAEADWVHWAPAANRLGYIGGEGRKWLEVKNKALHVKDMPPNGESIEVQVEGYADLDFTWVGSGQIVVSRYKAPQTQSYPLQPTPALYWLDIHSGKAQPFTSPSENEGDFSPQWLFKEKKLTWIRKTYKDDEHLDVWLADLDEGLEKVWIKDIDEVEWYNPPLQKGL